MSNKMLRVLFIGNSYTFFNKMPKVLFAETAKNAGYETEITEITHGGYRLCQYADPENEEGKRLRKTVEGKHYDFAVLQEQSLNPIKNEEQFIAGVGGVKSLVCADNFLLYATWGRNDGSSDLEALALTREEMTERLSAAYNKAGRLYGMRVAEVGKTFLAYSKEYSKDELYDPDKSHPSALGSKIAAEVIFQQMMISKS